ncbi:MAG: tetraacyldisaccharide 4'-kinase [Chitinophagaceae bacterium]|nr:tetraacyldisaccharide 4'-kinase [Bacteroidota bacterium]MBS1928013.1 tetraacyldisaccharide 4'-kinase [Bacteroidota bacterium]MCC6257688.1 tetraacyldisaccharide 4'-kinase [Chitinophagaceae bacterium]
MKKLRFLFLPIAWVHQIIVTLRNWFFDKGIFKSSTFNFPLICVGNLALGGTGKTPMVELLVTLLKDEFDVATLSRGYKRKTKGFAIANDRTTAIEIGDEPMQFHLKFPQITVAVGEERLVAIPQILQLRPKTDVIILDDAFQHRSVKAGINVLLTEQENLFTRDNMFPVGDLRDIPQSASRAQVIVITKCDPQISASEAEKIRKQISPQKEQKLFFACLKYKTPYHLFTYRELPLTSQTDVLLICGIANPKPLLRYLKETVRTVRTLKYSDHYIFKTDDLRTICENFDSIESSNKIILTTEKDAVRLVKYAIELSHYPLHVLSVSHAILFNQEPEFREYFVSFIRRFPTTGHDLASMQEN